MMYARVFFAVIGIFGVAIAPFWVPLFCALILAVRWGAPEALVIGLLMDLVWLPHSSLLLSLPLCTIVAITLTWGFAPLRNEFLLP